MCALMPIDEVKGGGGGGRIAWVVVVEGSVIVSLVEKLVCLEFRVVEETVAIDIF